MHLSRNIFLAPFQIMSAKFYTTEIEYNYKERGEDTSKIIQQLTHIPHVENAL